MWPIVVAAVLGCAACEPRRGTPPATTLAPRPPARPHSNPMRPLSEVLRDHTPALLRLPDVVGTGEGAERGRPVILILARRRSAALERELPAEIEGYAVRVREVGEVRADSTE